PSCKIQLPAWTAEFQNPVAARGSLASPTSEHEIRTGPTVLGFASVERSSACACRRNLALSQLIPAILISCHSGWLTNGRAELPACANSSITHARLAETT